MLIKRTLISYLEEILNIITIARFAERKTRNCDDSEIFAV